MDFDRNQFLTDVFEALVKAPGDPVRQIDGAIFRVIAAHTVTLHKLAQAHRQELIDMVEEHRKTGKPVPTSWKV
jgi:hypothetical protein